MLRVLHVNIVHIIIQHSALLQFPYYQNKYIML